jgi:two-component system CheB/CheR fusion protein
MTSADSHDLQAPPLREPAGDTPTRELPPSHPWVVAIGASAGGLEALQRFFGGLRLPTHAAFVVIQHLAPDHRSMMTELLSRHTVLPVREARAGDALEADNVYLMPPGVLMTLRDDHLEFVPRPEHGVSLPIDQFFRSLARARPERSIGVVLSGSGSDGAAGAADLRAHGGFVLVQRPDTARFDSMPRSTVASTSVDAVLPPEELAQRAMALAGGMAARTVHGELVSTPTVKPALQTLFETLRVQSGIDFSLYKLPTVMRRIERRMAVTGCASVSDYAALVTGSMDEQELLRRELLIPVTGFFRDPLAWEALRTQLRSLVRQQPPQQALRIWSAGCATGEEAYSVAILALEVCQEVQNWPGLKVFATDIDARFLAVASAGSYPVGASDAIDPARLARHFALGNERLTVKPELRQLVLFARHNLLDDAPFTKMDLVVCRNTLIYFQAEAQERVMRRLQYALNPGGILFLGGSESLGALQGDFQVIDQSSKIYRLVRPVITALAVRDGFNPSRVSARARHAVDPQGAIQPPSLVEEGTRQLLTQYVPLTLLVSPSRQLLHAWGPTERFLRVPEGQVNLDVTRLLPDRLSGIAGHALSVVIRQRVAHEAPPVPLERGGVVTLVRVVARPLAPDDKTEPCVLLSFEEVGNTLTASTERQATEAELDRLAELERELAESRASLQSHIEEMEATNEELQATNEELMSSNEELQSTNEELQSVNEELFTVNAEYNAKLEQVNTLHADLEGMSTSTGIATVFVDEALTLLRFTPEAALLFRLRNTDIGRSLADFNPQLEYPQLLDDLRGALDGLRPAERDVSGPGTSRYLVRVVGYGEKSLGTRRAVLSAIDISGLRDANRLQLLIDSLPEHMALIDGQGTIVQVNKAWGDFAACNGGDLTQVGVGANYIAALARSDGPDAAEVLRGLQRVLSGTQDHLRVTYPCHSPDRKRWFVMHVSPLAASTPGFTNGAVVTHLEITPWWGEGVPPPEGTHE